MRLAAVLAMLGLAPTPVAPAPQKVVVTPPVIVAQSVPYLDTIRDAAEMYFGVPAPVPVIVGQVYQESAFRPNAVSAAGAKGLMQFMDGTAKFAAGAGGFGAPKPFDPVWNLRAGIWYDRWIYDRLPYKSECEKWGATLSGFNGGLGWHNKRRATAAKPDDFWWSVRFQNPGILASNQMENENYPYVIVYRHQRKFLTLGKKVCL